MADLKSRLMQLLELSRSFQRQLIADLTPAERNAAGTWESWSIKDELAHVVAWQFNSLARMSALLQAEPVPDFSDFEAINQAVYRTNHERPLAEIVAEADRAHAELVKLIDASSEADLSELARFSDQGPRSLVAQIMGNGFEHPIAHYANYYQRHGDLGKATQLVEASVAAVADVPEWYGSARYNLACFCALSGQTDRAIAELRAALQLRPDLRDWSRQDADLAALRDVPAYQALYS